MTIRIGINGFGRIGRAILRQVIEDNRFEVVGINDLFLTPEHAAYMLKYDTVHGRFNLPIEVGEDSLIINNKEIRFFSESTLNNLPWAQYGAEYIVESTGVYTTLEQCQGHLDAGAKKVIITANSEDAPMFVYGVNHSSYDSSMSIISTGSAAVNCLAVIAKVFNDQYGIAEGLATFIHSVTANQKTVDRPHFTDWRMGRASGVNIIPALTSDANLIGQIIPELKGKMTGAAFHVPTLDVSVLDLTVRLYREASYQDICEAIKRASENELSGILGYTEDEVVSSDFIGDLRVCAFDAKASIVQSNDFVKLIAWFDNEWAYSGSAGVLGMIAYASTADNK